MIIWYFYNDKYAFAEKGINVRLIWDKYVKNIFNILMI